MFVLLTPLIGIWSVEQGAYAVSVGVPGYANGATEAFAAFVGLLLLVAFLSANGYLSSRSPKIRSSQTTRTSTGANSNFIHFSTRLLVLNGVFLLTMLFVFGGINVWLGSVEKGIFRSSLGPFGALPYMMTKFVLPALFAYSTLRLMQTDQRPRSKWIWRINALLVLLAGSTWGFKTTGLFMLLPGLLILNWKLPVHKLIIYVGLFFAFLMVSFYWFDADSMEGVEMLSFLVTRLTVIQGDVSWYIWGLYRDGQPLPNYWPTLLAAMGDTMLNKFVSQTDLVRWISYHYDSMLTYLAVDSLEAVANGHSVTGTPFSEGVIAAGRVGVALFAVVAGLLVGSFYRYLDIAIRTGRKTTAALLSTYFCFQVFAWLNGGAITQLFHISVLVYLLVTYLLLKAMLARRQHGVGTFSFQFLD